jgi:hypothetical protein
VTVADWLLLLLIVAALMGVGMLIAGARLEAQESRREVPPAPPPLPGRYPMGAAHPPADVDD